MKGDAEYAGVNWVSYDGGHEGDPWFVPVCVKCGRFVKKDEHVCTSGDGQLSPEPNATCSKCGRTHMIFMGFFGEEEING